MSVYCLTQVGIQSCLTDVLKLDYSSILRSNVHFKWGRKPNLLCSLLALRQLNLVNLACIIIDLNHILVFVLVVNSKLKKETKQQMPAGYCIWKPLTSTTTFLSFVLRTENINMAKQHIRI